MAKRSPAAANPDLVSLARRLRAWLEERLPESSSSEEAEIADPWHVAVLFLSSAERADNKSARAVAQALIFVLGCITDDEQPEFQTAASAVRITRALIAAIEEWRSSAEIVEMVSNSLRLHRELAATALRSESTPKRWTVWPLSKPAQPERAAATPNAAAPTSVPSFAASFAAQQREPYWAWTVWLSAAMRARRPEFAAHDLPERIDGVMQVITLLDGIARTIEASLYFAHPGVRAPQRGRGRPADYVRRELDNILRDSGLSDQEKAELLEDPMSPLAEDPVGTQVARLRGRRRRARAAARPKGTKSRPKRPKR